MTHDHAVVSIIVALMMFIICAPLVILMIVSLWKVFAKAGQPGWAAIIPIFNTYIWIKVAGRPGWWLILMLIPIVSLVIAIITCFDVAKAFGRSGLFAILLLLLPIIAVPILAFGSSVYTKPAAS